MTREEMLEQFHKKYVYEQNYQIVKSLDDYCKSEKEKLVEKFFNAFEELLSKIASLQEKGEKETIGYIHFYVLRTDILFKNYRVWISAYSDMFYMDLNPVEVSFDAPELFVFLDASHAYLLDNYKQYVGKVTIDDVSAALQRQALGTIRYVVNLARIATRRIHKNGRFQAIEQAENFIVSGGEYRDYSESLHVWLADRKSNIEIKNMINEKPKGAFNNEDFTDLDLQQLKLKNENFCFTDFSGSDLSSSDMRASAFIGASFSNCKMEYVNLKEAILHDADFENANLYGANFKKGIGGLTEPRIDALYSPGFGGVNFRHADLSGANFTDSNFSGSDFREAILKNTNFTGSNLSKALFDKAALGTIRLSDGQLKEIIAV